MVTGDNPVPDLVVGLSSPAIVTAGKNLTYTLSVRNDPALGKLPATNVMVTLTLPPGVTLLSKDDCTKVTASKVLCTIPSLLVGSHVDKTIKVQVNSGTRGTLTSTAEAKANEGDQDLSTNRTMATTTVKTEIALSIKKATLPAEVNAIAGKQLIYTLHVDNKGFSDATTVVVKDTLPETVDFVSADCPHVGRTVTCTIPRILPNGNEDRLITVMVKPSAGDGSQLANTASVVAAETGTVSKSFTATTPVVRNADLSVTKIAPSEVVAGETLTYELTACNHGPSNSASATITDDLPSGLQFLSSPAGCTSDESKKKVTCTTGPITAGGCAQGLSFVASVSPSFKAPALSNAAGIRGMEIDPNQANDSSNTVTTTVKIKADLSVLKIDGDPNSGKTARGISDFAVTEEAVAGANLVYSVQVRNEGPSDSPGGAIRDLLAPELSFVASPDECQIAKEGQNRGVSCPVPPLPAKQTYSVRFVVAVPADATGTITNQASVGGKDDPQGNNNTSNSISTTVKQVADLAVTVTGSPNPVELGQHLIYTVLVTNAGPSNAKNLDVSLTLPPGSSFDSASGQDWDCSVNDQEPKVVRCRVAALPTDAPISIDILAPNQGDTATATATVKSDTLDPNPANDTATETTTLAKDTDADIAVIKTAGVEAVVPGGLIPYRIEVVNRGPADVTEVVVTDDLAQGLFLDSFAPGRPDCDTAFGGGVLRCVFPLGAGDKRTINLVVRVEPGFRDREVENIAQNIAQNPAHDPNPDNNKGTVKTPVLHVAPLVLPFFKADSGAVNTLLAVRNPSEEEVFVRLDYFLTGDLAPKDCEHVCLQEKQTVTRSLFHRLLARLPQSLPADGYVGITPIGDCRNIVCMPTDLVTRMTSPPKPPLSGDFIRFEPPGHASGQPLVSTDTSRVPPELCRNWSVRFLNGGSFEGNTELFFFVPGNTGGSDPIAIGKVYGEDGKLVQEVSITASGESFRRTTQGLTVEERFDNGVPLLASFGAIEWEFPNRVGHVSAIHRNKDNFAVAVPGFCRDGDRSTVSPLLVPYFEIEPTGKATLFAVRNESDDAVTVHYEYFTDKGTIMGPSFQLLPHAANTTSLPFPPPDPPQKPTILQGPAKGYIKVVATGQEPLLSGDFVRIDLGTGLASGGPLVDENLPRQLCSSWSTRFLNGVPAGSTTDFVFHISTENLNPGTITGTVYDETGNQVGMVNITTTPTPAAFQLLALDPKLSGLLAQAGNGSIEWDLGEGVSGNVASILTATTPNKLSVLLPGVCLDQR